METLADYLIRSSIWLTGFALIYALFLRNERFFTLNRIYLVSGILVSAIFPFFTWHYTVLLPVVPTAEISDPQVLEIAEVSEPFPMQKVLLLSLYISGIIYLVFRILKQTLPVLRIIRKSEIHQFSSAKLIRTAEYPASFSFFSFVFVNPSISDAETNEIVNHEMEHIRQRHWIDLLLFELLCTIQWFNPMIWLYGRFIRQNNEYLADEQALQRTANPAVYRAALLNQMFGGPVISLANSFNYSLNKKRFTMMKQITYSPFRKLRLLSVLPFMAGVFFTFATPEYEFDNGAENQSPQKTLYYVSKEKIDIPFTTQYKKSDLDAVKDDLAKLGITINYTSLDFSEDGSLKQISASIKYPDGTGGSFVSRELTPSDHPGFKMEPNGSFGFYMQKSITGKVISDDGKPLKGASVVVSGKTTGTTTDNNGNFKLELTDDSPIVISYVGFETMKLKPDFEKEMVITLKTMTVGIEVMGNDVTVTKPEKSTKPVLIIIDGKESTRAEMTSINPDKIKAVYVLKGKESTDKYGEKGKDGVIEFMLKEEGGTTPDHIKLKKATSGSQNGMPGNFAIGYNTDLNTKHLSRPDLGITTKNTDTYSFDKVQPLIVKDGIISENLKIDDIDPNTIESINVLKGESATITYGEKGKDGVIEITTKKPGEVFIMVEEMPQFPGGFEALRTFVANTLKYPVIALENGICGQVFVKFVVDKTGNVSNAKVSRGVDPSLDKEALRIVESMPKWKPGTQAGENVEVSYEMPINFTFPAYYHPKSKEKLKQKSIESFEGIKPEVNQPGQIKKLIIVPNPTKDNATITLEGSDSNKKLAVTVFDRDGKLIRKESKNGPTFILSLANLTSGTYLIAAFDGETQFTGQLVVNH